MNIKKFLCLLLALVFTLSFAACGKNNGKPENETSETTGDTPSDKPYDYDLGEYVKLGNYPEVEYSKSALNTLVDNTIKEFCRRSAVDVDVTDRAAAIGDTVTIDYVGTIDGVAFENGSANDQSLTLDSKSYIEGFEEGVAGHNIGEKFDLNLKFPDPYKNSPDLAGKAVVFTVTLKKITEKQIPEFTDELAVKNGYESKDAFIEFANQKGLENVVWQSYLASAELLKTPEKETEKMKNNVNEYYKSLAASYKVEFDEFVKYLGFPDVETYNTTLDSQVKNAAKEEMVIYQTERIYNIEYTEEEYAELGLEVAKGLGYESFDEFKENASENDIRREVVRKKIINILCENAVEKE